MLLSCFRSAALLAGAAAPLNVVGGGAWIRSDAYASTEFCTVAFRLLGRELPAKPLYFEVLNFASIPRDSDEDQLKRPYLQACVEQYL